MRKPTMKYARIQDNILIVVPTEEGKHLFAELSDGVDKVGGVDVKAKIHEFKGQTIKNFSIKMIDPQNLITIRVYTSTGKEFNIKESMFVEVPDVKVEAVKK